MAAEQTPGRVDDVAYYAMMRSRLEHEDGLIVSRLAWLMASESFLFTAYAIVLNGTGSAQHARLLRLIPIVAIASSALIFVGIVAAVRAMAWIRATLRARLPDEAALGLPRLDTSGPVTAAGLAAPLVLPIVFVLVWLYLLRTQAA